ncbi:Putative MYB DNA-binding domain superfamily protein [Zea mays]|uniref:Putative MYB DNA-binding domain superfamily protein n=1 Tax=Zea mays TaxID=4577 RepID=A0A1D6IT76_MAIZE|nr:Putative MYB DNA-binding domain superfamily protein [Zea mays]
MNVDGLTNDEVKSHLQKYRLHTRRPNSAAAAVQSGGTSVVAPPAAPQFVVVGGIWVPPPDRCGSRSAAAAGAPSRRRVGNDDNSRRQGVRAGGDDVDARTATATATASGEAVEQLLRRAAQRGRLLWLAGRVVVVVAYRLCLMKRRRSVGRQLGF